jgi:hypothetical protein
MSSMLCSGFDIIISRLQYIQSFLNEYTSDKSSFPFYSASFPLIKFRILPFTGLAQQLVEVD